MKIGFIGLGKMGKEMILHLLECSVDAVVYNRTIEKLEEFVSVYKKLLLNGEKAEGTGELIPAYSYEEFLTSLELPRVIWIMVEHGKAVDEVIDNLIISGIKKNDIVIDGGNSFYKDSVKRYQKLKKSGVGFLDIGTSGGLEGARNGACLMVGGDKEIFDKAKPLLDKLSNGAGLTYFGSTGAGHFVKMVHNGVEYGMLQALGEGFELLYKSPYKPDLTEVATNWLKGSVVRGWLVELLKKAFEKDGKLENISGIIGGGSTGEWTANAASELGIEIPVIEKSVEARIKSKSRPTFSGKVVAALRREFGGHEIEKKNS
ncbi:6-phosphogluconate dehydrogenase (decarboxylating) [Candidatus Gottesmanbacteria bacterium RIFCSPHIGHO2_02_FULL_40_24]|uniref:6-phosphogluconate dehydrogenase (Decarboxylating) n=1 Tax=Candidatus Gottesmanbacteria bacterium RIFCSPHIGHO2_01_FULL_40_15 TaxID=1798376 RepID=A0A1F5YZG4_9BACT|nr:MAG: 6-phosphogluconate dehydrogenase (decarboxylating) [Candidatus Gottesmanbacteria bacterium RIFCSPHIGHO2_01_FULL_40_15]OGG17571.1 MAG: 6-phosphogluconate dehydrogenase (decarboxylating) [Candidatus Gottesmanbacteria bacterium RIFCSPHIGHO2_02_FULL_40_24]OGG23394.1 MAG: 6-phosphogluconate dehydrogenase (decarboxylating) [Candidatus Gottesmanbacteria bacterium RIFCSPHIGHO2_12_FULL_40_13]OGG33134.1 MAG: 6-phosphogluconate dehydrogenase (decarboxylating) [Candidatus Gottesmanbacteria bacterium